MKKTTWFLIVVVGAGLAYFEYTTHQPITLNRAIEKHYVEVVLQASDAKEVAIEARDGSDAKEVAAAEASDAKEVTATFTRTADAPSSLKLVIAAGTPISNADPGSQLLMTAQPVTVVLSVETPAVTTRIETYCVNQFGLEPTRSSSLAFLFEPSPGNYSGVETEPIQKLAQDLASSGELYSQRQMAVWMMACGCQNLTYDEAFQKLRQQHGRELQAETTAALDLGRKRFHERYPNYTEAEVEATMQRWRNNLFETETDAEAERLARQELKDFVANGERMLKFSDPNIGAKPFFVDVRSRGLKSEGAE